MTGLVRNECYKLVRLHKLYGFMGAALALQIIKIFQSLSQPRDTLALAWNGQSFPLEVIGSQSIVMAMFIAVLAADLAADEYRNGTMKLILLRPVDRSRLVAAKAVALLAAIAALVCFSVMAAYVAGTLAYGWGDRLLYQGVPIAGNSIATTVRAAFASIGPDAGFGMLVLLSALITEHVGITIGIALAIYIISPLLNLHEYSIVHQMNTFHEAAIYGASPGQWLFKLGIIAAYALLFFAAGAAYMKRKDVLL